MAQVLPENEEKTLVPEQTPRQARTVTPRFDRRRLFRAARWFVAEFAVVVCGVLVALALNAYYQGRQNATREQAYLQQVAADLRESERLFTAAIDQNEEDLERLGRLSAAFTAADPPPDDTLTDLTFINYDMAEPTTGAAHALLSTGDINLIQSDSVRSAIIGFIGASEAYAARLYRFEWEWVLPSLPSLRTLFAYARPNAQGEHPFAVVFSNLLEDPSFYSAVSDFELGFQNYVGLQAVMLEEIRRARRHVEGALREGAA